MLMQLTKAIINTHNHFVEVARVNRIRCLALCKIVYGERDWRVAEAHVHLANVYLNGKHYPHQVSQHFLRVKSVCVCVLYLFRRNFHAEPRFARNCAKISTEFLHFGTQKKMGRKFFAQPTPCFSLVLP